MSATPSSARIRLAVVNDYEIVVRGVAAMLEEHSDRIEVVELDADHPDGCPVDIALYDAFSMPSRTDRQIDELVHDEHVHKTVLYTWSLAPEVLEMARSRGIHAALPKSLDGAELAAALERVHAGEEILEESTTEAVGDEAVWPGRDEGLTARESEIVALITEGLSNNEIARRTFLSINSVKSYIRTAYRTMGVTSRSQAVLWGIDHGFARDRRRVLPSAGAPSTPPADDEQAGRP